MHPAPVGSVAIIPEASQFMNNDTTSSVLRPVEIREMVLEVADLDVSTHFYEELIGLTVASRWLGDRKAVWLAVGETTVLGLWPVASGGSKAIANGRGGVHVHFALRIPPGSIDEVQQRLESLGCTIRDRVGFEDGNRSLYLDDPDGNCLELMDAKVDPSGLPVPPRPPKNAALHIVIPPALQQERNGYLETSGRKSGLPRLTEIWFAAEGDRIYLLSGYHNNKDWVRNLTKTPGVRFRIGDRWFTGNAGRVTAGPEVDQARNLLATKYYGGDLSGGGNWAATGTPFAINLNLNHDTAPDTPDESTLQVIDNEPRTGFIETIGRTSGKPRETQIGFATDETRIHVIASKGKVNDWVKNLLRDPAVRFRIGESWYRGTAHVAEDEREIANVRSAMMAKYEDRGRPTAWIETGLPIVIDVKL